jgi:hypothetical protein
MIKFSSLMIGARIHSLAGLAKCEPPLAMASEEFPVMLESRAHHHERPHYS